MGTLLSFSKREFVFEMEKMGGGGGQGEKGGMMFVKRPWPEKSRERKGYWK